MSKQSVRAKAVATAAVAAALVGAATVAVPRLAERTHDRVEPLVITVGAASAQRTLDLDVAHLCEGCLADLEALTWDLASAPASQTTRVRLHAGTTGVPASTQALAAMACVAAHHPAETAYHYALNLTVRSAGRPVGAEPTLGQEARDAALELGIGDTATSACLDRGAPAVAPYRVTGLRPRLDGTPTDVDTVSFVLRGGAG